MAAFGWLEWVRMGDRSTWEAIEHVAVWLVGMLVVVAVRAQAVRQVREKEALLAQIDVSDQRWRAAVESTGDGLWDWRADTNACFYSATWKAMIGYQEHEFPDTHEAWVEHIHPEDRARVLESVAAHFAGRTKTHEAEYRLRSKDGSYRWVLGRGRVITRAADGRPLRAVGTHTDVTERRTVDERARLSLERHRFFLEHAADPMVAYHFRADGLPTAFVEVNAAACRLSGHTRERMLTMSPRDLEHGASLEKTARRLEEFRRNRRICFETDIRVADGRLVPVEFEAEIREFAGRAIVLATARDLRARREIEAQQRREAEQSKLLVELYSRAMVLSEDETYDHVLSVVVAVTQSQRGVLRWYGADGQEERRADWPGDMARDATGSGALAISGEESAWLECGLRAHTKVENTAGVTRFVAVPWSTTEGGGVIGVIGKETDYTAEDVARVQLIGEELRKVVLQLKAERALRVEQRRFRALFDHAPLGIMEEDFSRVKTRLDELRQTGVRDFRAYFGANPEELFVLADRVNVLIANQRSAELFGVDRPEDLQGSLRTNMADEAWPVVQEELIALAEGSTRFAAEIPATSKRGERLIFELSLAVVPGHEDKLDRVVVSFANITERRKSEAALLASERRYRRLVELLPEAILIIAQGRIVFANPAAALLLGTARPEELIGTDPLQLVHADSRAQVLERIRHLEAVERNPFVEQKWQRKDGSTIMVAVGASHFEFEGEAAHLLIVHDLSALRQAESELRKLARAVEQSPVTVMITDAKGQVEYVNPQFTKVTGYRLAEVQGQNPRMLNSGLQSNDGFQELWSTITAGREWRGEMCNRKKDGSLYWEEACISPLVDGAGGITGYLAVKEDVTAKRATLAALRASEQRFRSLAEGLPNIAVQGYDRERRVLFWNAASEALYGFSRTEAVGRRLEDLIVPDKLRDRMAIAVDRWVMHGEAIPAGEMVLRRKDGSPVTVFSSHVMLQQSSGELEIHRIDIDLTASKAAEGQIREQAGLINATRDAFVVIELDGRVRFWNHGAEQVYGWQAAEVQGKDLFDFLYDAKHPAPFDARQAVIEKGGWSGELRQRTKVGHTVIVRAHGQLLRDQTGTPTSILLTASDLTESKQLDAKFLRAQRLESVGALASGVAHDLNNVLSPIMMSVELLRPLAVTEPDREVLRLMSDSARRGADVVRQLLLFGRGADAPSETMDLAKVLKEIVRMVRETFPRNIAIASQCPRDLWAVRGHATEIYQVLLNFCVNARDAMPQGGELSIDAANQHVDGALARQNPGAHAGRYVVLRVADTGVGIPADIIDRIFDPFFTTKELGKGTGLGLSTVVGIAKSHGGFVTVSSCEGRGTEFRVYLPVSEVNQNGATPTSGGASWHGHGEQILVVDDEPAIRQVLSRALSENGYRVLVASNGAEALPLCVQHRTTLAAVVLDMMMPGIDGPQVIKLLREAAPALPVLACSGLHGYAASVEKLGLSRVVFVPKPIEIPRLMEHVRILIDAQTDDLRPAAVFSP